MGERRLLQKEKTSITGVTLHKRTHKNILLEIDEVPIRSFTEEPHTDFAVKSVKFA